MSQMAKAKIKISNLRKISSKFSISNHNTCTEEKKIQTRKRCSTRLLESPLRAAEVKSGKAVVSVPKSKFLDRTE